MCIYIYTQCIYHIRYIYISISIYHIYNIYIWYISYITHIYIYHYTVHSMLMLNSPSNHHQIPDLTHSGPPTLLANKPFSSASRWYRASLRWATTNLVKHHPRTLDPPIIGARVILLWKVFVFLYFTETTPFQGVSYKNWLVVEPPMWKKNYECHWTSSSQIWCWTLKEDTRHLKPPTEKRMDMLINLWPVHPLHNI